jgi:hypothetical protein
MLYHSTRLETLCRFVLLLALSQFLLHAFFLSVEPIPARDGALYISAVHIPDCEYNLTESTEKNPVPQWIRIVNSGIGNPIPLLLDARLLQKKCYHRIPAGNIFTVSHLRI